MRQRGRERKGEGKGESDRERKEERGDLTGVDPEQALSDVGIRKRPVGTMEVPNRQKIQLITVTGRDRSSRSDDKSLKRANASGRMSP